MTLTAKRSIFLFLWFPILAVYIYCWLSDVNFFDTLHIQAIILLVLLGSGIVETYFTKPSDVVINMVTGLSIMLPYVWEFTNKVITKEPKVFFADIHSYDFAISIISFISILFLVASILALILYNPKINVKNSSLKISNFLKEKTSIGAAKFYFPLLVLLGVWKYETDNDLNWCRVLFVFGLSVLIICIPKEKASNWFWSFFKKHNQDSSLIGLIERVEYPDVYICRLNDGENYKTYENEFVLINRGVWDKGKIEIGYVFDEFVHGNNYMLRLLSIPNDKYYKNVLKERIENIKFSEEKGVFAVTDSLKKKIEDGYKTKFDNLVGVIVEGSDIGTVRFEYLPPSDFEPENGKVVYLFDEKSGEKILYQIINAKTDEEKVGELTGEKYAYNQVIVTANQIGKWESEQASFETYGWVPSLNSPVFLVQENEKPEIDADISNWIEIGELPGTNYPVFIDPLDLITHHTVVLGQTGRGKTWMIMEILSKLVNDYKVVCIDYTGEYSKLSQYFGFEFAETTTLDNSTSSNFYNEVLYNDNKSSFLIEGPSAILNQSFLSYSSTFFSGLYTMASENKPKKPICLVLEEGHLIAPEWNVVPKNHQTLGNKIAQISLQGRKYNLGLLIITQRTALISKSVINQCNTVIAFNLFDETGYEFLSNYIGRDNCKRLPLLKNRQCFCFGKSISSNMPIVVQLPDYEEIHGKLDEYIENKDKALEKGDQGIIVDLDKSVDDFVDF